MGKREPGILCAGLVLADVLMSGLKDLPSHWEQTLLADGAVLGTGGGAANSARTLGLLGNTVSLIGCIGNDAFGELVKDQLMDAGVDCTGLRRSCRYSTGVAVGMVKQDGKRCFISARGANQDLDKKDFENLDPTTYGVLHINGFFQFPQLDFALPVILERYRKAGVKISLDTASWDASGRWFESISPFASQLDYLFLNDRQVCQMMQCGSVEEGAGILLAHGVGQVIVKLGALGCIRYRNGDPPLHTPAVKLSVVDTTGAGDSFDAAYLLGTIKGWDEAICARFANTVAGMNCCRVGATAGVPDFETACAKTQLLYHNE